MRQVFISHSSKDIAVAEKVVGTLEANGISCWVAPRDIPAGSIYGAEISKGIKNCSVLLLIFSENSNNSDAVIREVQLAFEEKKIIVPLRLEIIAPCDGLNFFLSGLQWWDVSPNNLIFDDLLKDIGEALNITDFKSVETLAPISEKKKTTDEIIEEAVENAINEAFEDIGTSGNSSRIALIALSPFVYVFLGAVFGWWAWAWIIIPMTAIISMVGTKKNRRH